MDGTCLLGQPLGRAERLAFLDDVAAGRFTVAGLATPAAFARG